MIPIATNGIASVFITTFDALSVMEVWLLEHISITIVVIDQLVVPSKNLDNYFLVLHA